MGCAGDALSGRDWSLGAALAIAAFAAPSCGEPASTQAGGEAPDPIVQASVEEELTQEELQLLSELDLFLDWELLKDWDPGEDAPSPLEALAPDGSLEEGR